MYKMYKSINCVICVFIMLLLCSCSFFQIRKPVIIQGNIIEPQEVSQLHPGMTPAQVVSIMGAPVLANILTPDRIVYVYSYNDGLRKHQEKRVVLLFAHGRLQSIQREGV